jgi:hypothetical protein
MNSSINFFAKTFPLKLTSKTTTQIYKLMATKPAHTLNPNILICTNLIRLQQT